MSSENTIIVTGGSGFLGKHLCRSLVAAGCEVKNIDLRPNDEVPTVIADIRDLEQMRREIKDAKAVFHLAALIEAGESVKIPQQFIDSNITGSLNVLQAMKENGIYSIIISSSAAVYGDPVRVPIFEDDRTIPINPYGMTKLAMEALLSSYVASYGFTGAGLRYFNLYGPGENHQPETHAIPRFVKQILNSEEVTIWGQGEHLRDYIHVKDVASAHIKVLALMEKEPNKYHYFNLSAETPTKVIDIVHKLEEILQLPANIKFFPNRPGDPLKLFADSSKAREQLGWKAEVKLEDGLRETVEFLKTLQ